MQLDLAVLPGSEGRLQEFGQEIAQIIQFYNSKFWSVPARLEVCGYGDRR